MKLISQWDVINGRYICLNASYSSDNLYGDLQSNVHAQRFCEEKLKLPRSPRRGFTGYFMYFYN